MNGVATAEQFVSRLAVKRETARIAAMLEKTLTLHAIASRSLGVGTPGTIEFDELTAEHEALSIQLDFLAKKLEIMREKARAFETPESKPVTFLGIE